MERPVSLKQLLVFTEVARGASLSEAAERLLMSKSSVSQSLTELEARMGASLFERLGGRLRLNDAGRKLLPLADDLLSRAKHLPQIFGKTPSDPLCLGVTESVAAHYLMPSLSEFRRRSGRFPKVLIGNTDDMIRSLADYKLDLALVEGLVTDPDMDVTLWQEERLFIVAAVDHPLHDRTVSWEELREVDWVLREPGSGSRLYFESHLREKLGHDLSVLVLNHHDTLLRAVASGLGVSLVAEGVLSDPHFGGKLCALNVPEHFSRRLSFVVRRGKFETDDMKLWREILSVRRGCEPLQ